MADAGAKKKFDELATKRMRNVLIGLRRVRNLASPGYDHNGHQARYNAMIGQIAAVVDRMYENPRLTDEAVDALVKEALK